MSDEECRKRYGYARRAICRLPAGHKGRHAARRSLKQIIRSLP